MRRSHVPLSYLEMFELFIIALVLAWSIQTVWHWKRARLLRAEIVELEKTLAGARVANEILQKSLKGEDDFTLEEWPSTIQ